MFDKVLVANRGEIAVRVMRTLREMGISSVAVYSDVDRVALHVSTADESVCLGDPDPASSYLNIEKIIDAAKEKGAQAIHPGYGFLSENPEFASAVDESGLVFIGPPAKAMSRLGDKTVARKMMQDSGVPVIPGMMEPGSDITTLAAAADEIGYPILIKASSGGGGKGMRVVSVPDELEDSAKLASSEAGAAFGNDAIYLEKYIERPRHVEFQVLADNHGNTVHVFERECSIQRRHQKIVEETPSPALDQALRDEMGEAAVSAARAAGYVNAGTVEFLLAPDRSFFFLEVNTRLQVEHPVTEMVTGLDLVRCQIEIACGNKLPFKQEDLASRGHSIECRIYAEDPETGFMPCPGTVIEALTPEGPGVRYDKGVISGSDVPVHYDPIIGKLIVHALDRESAISRMTRALEECVILGVGTQIDFLIDIMRSPQFHDGDTHTGFIDEHMADWARDESMDHLAAIGHLINGRCSNDPAYSPVAPERATEGSSPWHRLGSWNMEGDN